MSWLAPATCWQASNLQQLHLVVGHSSLLLGLPAVLECRLAFGMKALTGQRKHPSPPVKGKAYYTLFWPAQVASMGSDNTPAAVTAHPSKYPALQKTNARSVRPSSAFYSQPFHPYYASLASFPPRTNTHCRAPCSCCRQGSLQYTSLPVA